jgi:hypothetical protein
LPDSASLHAREGDDIRTDGLGAVIAQLRFHPALAYHIPELHPQLPVNAIDFLDVDTPPLAAQKDMNPSVTIPDTRFADLSDPFCNGSLIGAAGLVMER